MNKLEEARKKINEADEMIRKAFEERMKAVEDVISYKKENNLPIFDAKREDEVIKRNVLEIKNSNYRSYYEELLRLMLDLSKDYQGKLIKKRYGLVGKSLKHSLSPLIHQSFFEHFNIDGFYELIEIEENEVEKVVKDLRNQKYVGINITIPYKTSFLPYLDYLDENAKAIGSINTIKVKNGKLYGYNTDYDGFLYLLKKANINPKGLDCYILGTGGASLACKKVLLDLGAKSVNRVSRSQKMEAISYEELATRNIDLLVNATPVGMYPLVNDSPLNENIIKNTKLGIDLIYNPVQTKFLKELKSNFNGLPMLLYQAYKAEEIWQDSSFQYEDWLEEVGEKIESLW